MPIARCSAMPRPSGERRCRALAGGARYEVAGRSARRHCGRDHHVKHGAGDRAAQFRHSHVARQRRRQIRAGRDAEERRRAGRGTVRPHYFSRWRSHHRRWPADGVARDGNHGADGKATGGIGRRPESFSADDSKCPRARESSLSTSARDSSRRSKMPNANWMATAAWWCATRGPRRWRG